MIFHKIKKERQKSYISPRPYDKNWKEQYNIKVKNHSNDLIDNDLLIAFCSYIKNKYKKSKKIFINYYNHNDITVEDDKTKKTNNSYSNSNINYGNFQVLKLRRGGLSYPYALTQSQIFNSLKIVNSSMYGSFGKSLYFQNLQSKKYNFDNMFIIDDVLYICETDEERLMMNRKVKIEKIKNGIIKNKEKVRQEW